MLKIIWLIFLKKIELYSYFNYMIFENNFFCFKKSKVGYLFIYLKSSNFFSFLR